MNAPLDKETLSAEQKCSVDGHLFEGYEADTEICSICDLVRERFVKVNEHGAEIAPDGVPACSNMGNHSFDPTGICLYCGRTQHVLGDAEDLADRD